MKILKIILFFISLNIILLTLLQSNKSSNDGVIGNLFNDNESLELFYNIKESSLEILISNLTLIFGIFFYIVILLINKTNFF